MAASVRRLHAHLTAGFPYRFRITVADNASTDGTPAVAERLAAELPEVRAVHLAEKGRGRALRAVWSTSDAPVLAYMDVDLSTDLNALLPLVAPLDLRPLRPGDRHPAAPRLAGWYAGAKRELVSRCYNLLLRGTLRRPVQRRAVRLQGRPPRRRGATPPAGRGHRLVLRHGAAGAGRAGRATDPRGSRRLGGRPGQPRRHPRHRGRGPAGHRQARPARWRPGGCRSAAAAGPARPRAAGPGHRGRAAWADPPAGAVRRHRGRQHGGVPAALPAAAHRPVRAAGQPARAAADRGGEHRRQPAAHLRRHRPPRRDPPPAAGPGRLRTRAGADERLAGGAARGRRRRPGGGRGRRPGGGQPGGHGAALPAPALLGVQAPPPSGRARDRRATQGPEAVPDRERTAGGRPGRMQPTGTRQEDWT